MNKQFKSASQMFYANSDFIKNKSMTLIDRLSEYLETIKQNEVFLFKKDDVVYVPDVHGDFVHMIIALYKHGVLESNLNLKNEFKYVFLGDIYDRAPDSDVIDFWLNYQLENGVEVYKLIGNHEMAFLERNEEGYPIIFPSQDSIKDVSNNFQITEDLLKQIANGNVLAAFCNDQTLYVHSYIMNDDYTELGLEKNSDLLDFVMTLNKRFNEHGKESYDLYLECKKKGQYNWKEIIKPFKGDPLFDLHKRKKEIHSSFIWRRTGIPSLNVFPSELEVEIPDDVYQIVGHTPVFSFRIPNNQSVTLPFVIPSISGSGKIQFSDVGIGYYYKKESFDRPEVMISNLMRCE